MGAIQMRKQTVDLGPGQNHRHLHRRFRARDAIEPGQLDLQHLTIKEQQCRERLILCGGTDITFHRQMAQECLDLGRAHVAGMPFVVIRCSAGSSADIRLFSAQTVVLDANTLAYPVQQARARRANRIVRRVSHDRSSRNNGLEMERMYYKARGLFYT